MDGWRGSIAGGYSSRSIADAGDKSHREMTGQVIYTCIMEPHHLEGNNRVGEEEAKRRQCDADTTIHL